MSLARISDDLKHYRSAYFLTQFAQFLRQVVLIRIVCLLYRDSPRSENTINENNHYVLIKEESMYTCNAENVFSI